MDGSGRLSLWGIEVFLAVADDRSISAAARRLGASPSSVSQQLSNLEAALGTVLCDRSSRPVALTPAGHLFRARAQTILDEARQARAELADRRLARLDRLRLGMVEDFDADVTPGLLRRLGRELEECRFFLETGASHRLLDQLETGALDIVVTADHGVPAGKFARHPVLRDPFVAALPKGSTTDSLQDIPLIGYTQRHLMGRQIAAHLLQAGLRFPQRVELDSYHAILAMVADGQGWSILTPLAIARAQRFRDLIDLHPTPGGPFFRQIALFARTEGMGDLPGRVAAHARELVSDRIVGPARAHWPWLADAIDVLPE